MSISIDIPLRLESLNKRYSCWQEKARAHKRERSIVGWHLKTLPQRPKLPVVVTVTRMAPKALDGHDNLPGSAKRLVDEVAAWLKIDDADPRATWAYAQQTSKEYVARVSFSEAQE